MIPERRHQIEELYDEVFNLEPGTDELTPLPVAIKSGSRWQGFLMIKESEQSTPATQIKFVLNWVEELKQKVPAGKK